MSGSGYNPRHSDRHYRSDRSYSYHDHRSERDRDSRDRYYSDHNHRRVPGLVSDPQNQLGDVDRAIERGQRETINRVKSDRYSPSKPTRDTMDPPAYNSHIHTVSRPYYPSTSIRTKYTKSSSGRTFYNPSFLGFIPGLCGLALLIAAIVLPTWTVSIIIANGSSSMVDERGLFQVCSITYLSDSISDKGCVTLESFAESGTVISDLEQATRGMVIIGAVFAFTSLIVSFIFGLNRWERRRGALISGGCYLFAGICAVSGMGCFSATLVTRIGASSISSFTSAGAAFYLGWVGTSFLLVAAVVSFMAHCAKRK